MRLPRSLVRRLGRVADRLPDRVTEAVLVARSLRSSVPTIGIPAFETVLVLAAHPDDEAVGCGGLMALLADAGAAVHVVFATDGEATVGPNLAPDEIASRRRAEAIESCRVLGSLAPRFLGYPDGSLDDHVDDLERDFTDLIAEIGPDVVLAPWQYDGHADHRAVARAVPGGVDVWGYEVWTPLPPTWIVDVSAVQDRKEEAVRCHETASAAFDLTALLALGRFRSVSGLRGRGTAEAYLTTRLPEE